MIVFTQSFQSVCYFRFGYIRIDMIEIINGHCCFHIYGLDKIYTFRFLQKHDFVKFFVIHIISIGDQPPR